MSAGSPERGIEVLADAGPAQEQVLTEGALSFLAQLQRSLRAERAALLGQRQERQAELDRGWMPDFLPSTAALREDRSWSVAAPPEDLMERRVEITGPVEAKMMINALNSGASTYMADFEDAFSPTWANCMEGEANLMAAARRTLSLDLGGKAYRLQPKLATLMVRPRGWHLSDKHLLVDGEPISASLQDFGLFVFHNAEELLARGSGPYLYLPKLENHLEARLWERACSLAEEALAIPHGSIRATVLVENILTVFEMEEVLFELRGRSVGLNAGRWDYLFSVISKFRERPEFSLPDRVKVVMTVPFMQAYTELLVATCHRRRAHAIGGMAAAVPNRRDPERTRVALERVAQDKLREVGQGFDGTWVAHPDLVETARSVFADRLRDRPNQVDRLRDDVRVGREELLDVAATPGEMTPAGLSTNVSVGVRYLASWLKGQGAVAIDDLMEDSATAEISRSQIWQWLHHGKVTPEQVAAEEERQMSLLGEGHEAARELFSEVATSPRFVDFLTLPGYRLLP